MQNIKIIRFDKIGKILKYPDNENKEEIFTPITNLDLIILQHAIENNQSQLTIYDLTEKFQISNLKFNGQNFLYEKLKYNTIENIQKEYPTEKLNKLIKG